MYKIIGLDGKEYGPARIEQLKKWISEGRIHAKTQIQGPNSPEWKPAIDFPELSIWFSPAQPPNPAPTPASPPTFSPVTPSLQPLKALAVTSFMLGILSIVCLTVFAGIPAIICGHIAHSRARRLPSQYGGAGFAIAGFVLGYVSLAFAVLIVSMLVPAFSRARNRGSTVACVSQMRQIGLALRLWGVDHKDEFPFNVSTNQGGTKELCDRGADGFDQNAPVHFMSISNELGKTTALICPQDTSKHPASDFSTLSAAHITYRLRTGPELSDRSSEILAECPIHHIRLLCNGNVEETPFLRRVGKAGGD